MNNFKNFVRKNGKGIIIGGVLYSISKKAFYMFIAKTKIMKIEKHSFIGKEDFVKPKLTNGECISFNDCIGINMGIDNLKIKDLKTLQDDLLNIDGFTNETKITTMIKFHEEESE